jgi:hypothetical protein
MTPREEQEAPPPPEEFTVQDTPSGQVLADARGRTLYSYTCGDDAPDQLSCESPADTQVYRLAMCGGGSAERCERNFPYVEAATDARSQSRLERREIDPATGHSPPGTGRALRVWAYRERPVPPCRRGSPGKSTPTGGRIPVGTRRVPRFLVARRFLQPVTER